MPITLAASALVCATLCLVVWKVFPGNLSLFSELSLFNWLPVWSAIMIGVFGALLGPDRRWWPWSLAPIAFLLSGAVPLAFAVGPGEPNRTVIWGMLGLVPLLVGIALVGSAWRPLAGVFSRSRAFSRATAWSPAGWRTERVSMRRDPDLPTRATRRVRPTAVLNGIALALVILSMTAFENDPWIVRIGTQISSSDILMRTMAQDVRTRRNLREALGVMDTYRADHGTYSGFTAAAGRAALPSIRWHAGPVVTKTRPLTVAVLGASADHARLAAMSSSGAAFCLERTAVGIRYGKSSKGLNTTHAFRSAVAACGSELWTSHALTPPPVIHCPTYVNGYLMCRMLAVIRYETLRSPQGV